MDVTPRVLVVEEDAEVRHAIRRLCELEGLVMREAGSATAAETLATVFGAEVAIISNGSSQAHGEKAAQLIRRVSPQTEVLAFSVVLEQCLLGADSLGR